MPYHRLHSALCPEMSTEHTNSNAVNLRHVCLPEAFIQDVLFIFLLGLGWVWGGSAH